MQTSENLMSSRSLEDNDVINNEGEDLGNIKDFMLDCGSGRVVYAVLSYGGILGMGEKLFAVPMNALRLDTNNKCFVLNAQKEVLKNAPGFDKSNWPNMADRKWGENIHTYYKTQPHWNNKDN